MGKQTSPIKKSTTINNNKDITTNSVSGDINENMIGSLSNSIEKNNRNQVSGSPLPNNVHKGSPLKGKDGERSYVKDMIKQLVNDSNKDSPHGILEQKSEQVVVDNYYRELVRLVNQQREKISAQQIDLTKYEAEIAFTEGYCKEEESRLNYIKAEIQRWENVSSDSADTSSQVKYSVEELEEQLREAQASENKAIEDVENIKKKMSNYDQQLNQMKNKICTLQEVLDQEESLQKLNLSERVHGEEQGAIMREIEKLQSAINQSTNQADYAQNVSQQLSQELHEADARLTEKKNEIEKLKEAMREANMEALAMMPVEELKTPSDKTGIAKNGTSRRMKGSPRQLETAVPTSKNPHGVWV